MTEPIRYDEWLSEVSRVTVVHPDVFTTRQLMESIPCGERRAENLIRQGLAMGVLRPTRKQITDMAGRPQTIPAYEPVKREVPPCPKSGRGTKTTRHGG